MLIVHQLNHWHLLGTSEVTIVAVNDAPVLTGGGNTIQFSEGDPAVVLDNAITLSDHEGSAATTVTVQLTGATGVTITNSEILEFDATASTKVTGALSNNNQTLTITQASGVTDAANSDFQALLRTVKYKNTDTATADGNRTITFSAVETANGQNFTSADIVTTVSVAALNDDAPVLGGARSDATNYAKAADAAKFTEAGTAVVLESGLTVADSDHANLTSAIRVSEGYVKNEDKLALATTTGSAGEGFTVVWDADTGTLTVSGDKTKAQYAAALKTVTYDNENNDNPSTADRKIEWRLYDGANYSQ